MMDICRSVKGLIDSRLPDIKALHNQRSLKPDGSWVTRGDLFVQELVSAMLEESGEDVLLISEERQPDMDKVPEVEYVVTLDPIDGTANFTFGMADWGVIVSVYRNMKHWQSMIYLPEMNRCIITGDKFERYQGSGIRGLSTYVSAEDYAELGADGNNRMMGSCAVNFYYVITGAYRSLRHYKGAYSWDIMAGLNLSLEHGLKVYLDSKEYRGEWIAPGERHKYFVTE